MSHNIVIFKYIKENKWDKIKHLLQKHKNIDVNIRDTSNNYILNYAIVQNKEDIVKKLLNMGAMIDITDIEGRSILYYCIKFRYNNIIDILLNHNARNINIPITNILDNYGQIPLFYAVQYTNIYAIKKLLNYNSKINTVDNKGLNCLHYAIHLKNYNICKLLIDNNINVNTVTSNGDNALHLACMYKLFNISKLLVNNGININCQNYGYSLSALHYAVINTQFDIIKLLIDNNVALNIQDYMGNTVIHYVVKYNNKKLINILLNAGSDANIFNNNGELAIHIAATSKYIYIIKILAKISNLNHQDVNGNTPLHILTKNKYWESLSNILSKKKLNIFIKNNNGTRPIDYVQKEYIDKYIDIVVNSYIYILKNNDQIWNEEWEKECSKSISKYSDSKCKEFIRKKIYNLYKSGTTCSNESYPAKKYRSCVVVSNGSNVEFCTFSGTPLEISIGIIYLTNKHKDICKTYIKNYAINDELCNYYKKYGIFTKKKCEFLNFEIVWIDKKLILPSNFNERFAKCCSDGCRFVIIPLGIELKIGNHSNYIVYDKKINEIERFEPVGDNTPYNFDYLPKLLDNKLEKLFSNILNSVKYVKPSDFLPKAGFQQFSSNDINRSKIGDPDGFCALWSVWYVDYRITYADVDRQKLVKKMIKSIRSQNISFKNLIRNYSNDIVTMRDKVLSNSNLTINDWINGNYTENQVDKVISNTISLIDK